MRILYLVCRRDGMRRPEVRRIGDELIVEDVVAVVDGVVGAVDPLQRCRVERCRNDLLTVARNAFLPLLLSVVPSIFN